MDLQIIALAVGLMVSLLFSERSGLSAGGMIVPGYFALSLHRPFCIVLTLLAAVAVLLLVRLLSQAVVVYGRRRIALTLILGFLVGTGFRLLAAHLQPSLAADTVQPILSVIGFIIPGLIALWMAVRQIELDSSEDASRDTRHHVPFSARVQRTETCVATGRRCRWPSQLPEAEA
jgi:poly-gamma-glutamate biosynthesis protein PgsC/CapC